MAALAAAALPAAAQAEPFVYANGGAIHYHDGASSRLITTGAGDPAWPAERPALSPDGRRIAYNDGCSGLACGYNNWGTIFMTSTDGGRGDILLPQFGEFQTDVSFLSDGRSLTYARTSASNSWDIWTADVTGGNHRLVVGWPNAQLRPDFSPDRTKVTFTSYSSQSGASYADGSRHIFIADASGLNPRDMGIGWNSSFSPDGTKIAFERSSQLFVMDVTGANLKQVTKGRTGVAEPDWGNGQRIAYQRADGTMAAINADGSGAVSYGTGVAPSLQQTSRMTEADVLSSFAPEIRYDSIENYYADDPGAATNMYQTAPPSTPERAGSNRLMDELGNELANSAPPTLVGSPPQLTLSFLGNPAYADGRQSSSSDFISLRGSSEDDYIPDSQYMHNQGIYGNKTYSRRVVDGGMTWLQYWFFYYYNVVPGALQIGDHEGDWEMIQVGLNAQNVPQVVTFAAHGDDEAISCPWSAVEKTVSGGDHVPVVYVAQGTHASYPYAGEWGRGALPNDNADGAVWIRPTMVHGALNPGVGWVSWTGMWGDSHDNLNPGEQASPQGPMHQGPKWSSPSTFNAQARACTAPSSTTASASRTPTRTAPAPGSLVNRAVPAVAATADRAGRSVTVDYRLDRWPARRADRPTSLLVSVDPKGSRTQPRTYTHRLTGLAGRVRQSMPVGDGPYTLRVLAITADGRRGPVTRRKLG